MDFRVYKLATKKGTKYEIHTPSCSRSVGFKKRDIKYTKHEALHADELLGRLQSAGGVATVHPKCCKPFRAANTKNPPCPHCGNDRTVFQSNIGVGKKEFTCTSCKKLFTILKEKKMKIKLNGGDKKTKRTERQAARAEKKALRVKAREERTAARTITRIDRITTRLVKGFQRLEKVSGSPVSGILAEIEAFRISHGVVPKKAKAEKKPVAKKTAKKKVAAKKR